MSALTAADLADEDIEVVQAARLSGGWVTAATWEPMYGSALQRLVAGEVLEYRPNDKVRRYVLTDAGKTLAEELGR